MSGCQMSGSCSRMARGGCPMQGQGGSRGRNSCGGSGSRGVSQCSRGSGRGCSASAAQGDRGSARSAQAGMPQLTAEQMQQIMPMIVQFFERLMQMLPQGGAGKVPAVAGT